ncbi:MAG: LysM peptidoglycan-binding domain-containing protein [Verrucomicrobia bacterium]|nr:LysM peptidoglycan-binding domain-containing protein [Verrucomicrobiota bacterium]
MVFLMRHRLLLIPGILFSCGAVWSSAQPADPSAPSSSAPVAAAESRTYQVRKGDTFESIARRHGCSVRGLIELNGLKPTTVLQIGMPLKLPAAQVNEAASVPTTALPAEGTHTIAKGDTFAVLAKKYGIPSSELLAANPGVNPTKLQIGQVVKLRRDADTSTNTAATAPSTSEPPASAESAAAPTPPAVDATAVADAPSPPATTESAAPAPEPSPPPAAIVVREEEIESSATHTVRKGDTFATIAKKHRVSVRQIEQANPGVKSNRLKIGQTLRIQQPKAAPKEESKPTAPPAIAEAAPPMTQSPDAAAAPSTPTPAAAATEPPAPAVVSAPPPAPTNETASTETAVTSPPPAPPSAAAPAAPPPAAPSPRAIESRKQVLRRVSEPMTFGEFAASQGCTVEELNALNGYSMTPDSILSAAAEVLVPLPPDTDP